VLVGSALVAVAVAVAALMNIAIAPPSGSPGADPPHNAPASSAAPVDTTGGAPSTRCSGPVVDIDGDGCDDEVRLDGEVVEVGDARYALGIAGDVAAVGDWDCDGIATARVLRVTSGEVFEFPNWATSEADQVGEHVAT